MSDLLICPICGFSFRIQNAKREKDKIICPMCGHKFMDFSTLPLNFREFDNK